MIDSVRKKFIEYVKNYDLKIPEIMEKFHHSFRVMEYSKEIARSLNLNDKDTDLALVIGLLHDIARFEQWTKYKTFKTSESIDHGNLGYDILKDFLEEFMDKAIILKAVKNHNKLKIEDGLDERTLLFCKIVRDADKLDIMKEQGLILTENIDSLNPNVMKTIHNKTIFNDNEYKNESDSIFRILTFVFDLNFEYSYNFVKENKIIENKINLLEVYSNEIEQLEDIKNELLNYVND